MKNFLLLLFTCIVLFSCSEEPVPKPRAYFRIPFPEKKYAMVDTLDCPFRFELPSYAYLMASPDMPAGERCWSNIYFPRFKGEIYLTYKEIKGEVTLERLIEDQHEATYTHQSMADNITALPIADTAKNIYGLIFNVEGNVASQMQFVVTDSTKHFVRGALYFAVPPNKDSIEPVVRYIRKDVEHMLRSFEWK